MNQRPEFFQEISHLERLMYIFVQIDNVVYLDCMYYQKRESTRHKYRIENNLSYSRLNKRDNRIQEEPEVPIEISAEAVQHFRKMVTFKSWKDRR